MSIFEFSTVKDHIKLISKPVQHKLDDIREGLIKAKEDNNLPIYLVTSRKKGKSSAYLKTKRKTYEELSEITDYGGLRILCMFEQDIEKVHNYIVHNIIEEFGLTLNEFRVFNWNKTEEEKLNKIVSDKFGEDVVSLSDDKLSGYRSVHYVVELEKSPNIPVICMEIQLRTLLQDAWGELEHSLGYKQGAIHPHIKESFKLLSQDLATNDALINHLKSISEHECILRETAHKNSSPVKFFLYDNNLYPNKFLQDNNIWKNVKAYEKYVDDNIEKKSKKWAVEARKKISDISKNFNANEVAEDIKFAYWKKMEIAYLDFQEGELNKAFEMYNHIAFSEKYPKTYVTDFRLGEVAMKLGKTTKALIAFDDSEKLYQKCEKNIENQIDICYIKINLAYLYWELGEQFYKTSLDEMYKAEEFFEKIKNELPEKNKVRRKIENGLCWYNLEIFILDKKKNTKFLNYAETYFLKLQSDVQNMGITAMDTCAWFSYQKYLHLKNDSEEESLSWLSQANSFCEKMVAINYRGDACVGFLDDDIMKSHYLTIKESYLKK